MRKAAYRPLTDILKDLDPELVRGALGGEHFQEYFFADCKCEEIAGGSSEDFGACLKKREWLSAGRFAG